MKKNANKLIPDKGPLIRTTYETMTSLYKSDKDKKPLISISSAGDHKISLLRLALMLIGSIFAAMLAALIIKRTVGKCRAKKQAKKRPHLPESDEGIWYYDDEGHLVWQRNPDEELPF